MRPSHLVVVVISLICSIASADPLSHLSGRVLDSKHATPVEQALVLVAGPGGVEHTLITDSNGLYTVDVAPGSYILVFIYGSARSSGHVDVVAGRPAKLDGRVDSTEGEVIVIRDKIHPPVPPRATNFKPRKAPPYSDRAILSDAWTRAWMLLDISATGQLIRMKWLKRPGYDLDDIAIKEIKKLTFTPARNASGQAIRAYIVWGIEWPSAWWLSQFVGVRSGMPPIVGYPPHRLDWKVPCAGSGPWHVGSIKPGYKDCSTPNLAAAAHEAWIVP